MDTVWFYQQLEAEGRSLRAMARAIGIDPSAVSRMLRGERKMTAEDQDRIADYLGVSVLEVAARRRGGGFTERGQEPFRADDGNGEHQDDVEIATAENFYDRLFGCMKGTLTIAPGVDLTEPADPEWASVFDDD